MFTRLLVWKVSRLGRDLRRGDNCAGGEEYVTAVGSKLRTVLYPAAVPGPVTGPPLQRWPIVLRVR